MNTLDDIALRLSALADDLARVALTDRPDRPARTRSDVLAIPFYFVANRDRAAVTRKVFRHYANVAEKFSLEVVGLGSEGHLSRDLWAEFFPEDHYREYPQAWTGSASGAGSEMLRAKFDETVRATRMFDPDRVFIVGSDDILTEGFFAAALDSPADLVGVASGEPDSVRIVRMARRQVHVWNGCYEWAPDIQLCGGGVGISRRLLDRWKFAPFAEPGDEVGIERRARKDGASIEPVVPSPTSFRFWAVKLETAVLNGWRQVANVRPTRAPSSMFTEFAAMWDLL